MTEADLQRATELANNPDNWEIGEMLEALVARVRALTDAGNQLAAAGDVLLPSGAPMTTPAWDYHQALDAWRTLTEPTQPTEGE